MRLRRSFGALLVLGAVALPVAGADVACAAGQDRAVLAVDTGAAEYRFCVALGSRSVSGIDLIKLAGTQHGLDYALGHGGAAVCRLAGVGPDGGDCFGDYPDYWGYWRGDGGGGWAWSSSGAGSTSVEDGDVEGWSWGRGDSGSTHQAPPPTTFDEVCPKLEDPAAANRPRRKVKPRSSDPPAGPAAAEVSPVPRPEEVEPKEPRLRPHANRHAPSRRPGRRAAARAEQPPGPLLTPTPVPTVPPAAAARAEGPPGTGVVALGIALGFGVAGGLVARRRRRSRVR